MRPTARRSCSRSLADARLGTTPALVKLRDGGALSFERAYAPSVDARVADRALEQLERVAGGSGRFFGLVSFASPHAPYPDVRDPRELLQ